MRNLRWRRLAAVLLIALVLVVTAGLVWFALPQQTMPEAEAALVSSATVTVDDSGGRITFTPVTGSDTGLILYPGGKVEAQAYAPPARLIAEEGYLVVVVSMPLNFAVFDVGAADGVIADHPGIRHWAIGGHSLGGAMAGQYVASRPAAVEGLVLWAAYSAADVSASGLLSAVIYGTLDSGAERFISAESLALLPPDPAITVIEGGNHANFAWYTGQPNDPPATITREEQQAEAARATVELLQQLASR